MKNLFVLLFITISGGLFSQDLLEPYVWESGTTTPTGYLAKGDSGENLREMGIGPQGTNVVLWKASPNGNGGSSGDGGYDSPYVPIDHTKTYRVTVWIKKNNSNNGTTYFGLYSRDANLAYTTVNLANVAVPNAYFWFGDLPQLDTWYLLVGYVHHSGYTSTTKLGGIYNGTTGVKVANTTHDFKFSIGADKLLNRAYLFYDSDPLDNQYFYQPRIEEVNGNEPTIEQLIAGNTNDNNSGNANTAADPSNVFVGMDAGASNTTGRDNSFVGSNSGNANTTGVSNSFFGNRAGSRNTTGSANSFFGSYAGSYNTTANNNTFFGQAAGANNETGQSNTYIGSDAGGENSEGNRNVFIGFETGQANEEGSNNVFIGAGAGLENFGSDNTFIGEKAGTNSGESIGNVFIGKESGAATNSNNNTFVGTSSGKNNTTGTNNVFNGYNAGLNNTTGNSNTFIGFASGSNNVTGYANIFIGGSSGEENNGSGNVFIGESSGGVNELGVNNVILGTNAGNENNGSRNVFIGNSAGQFAQGDDKLYIDNSGTLTPLIYGNFATDQLGINTNTIPDGYNFAVGGSAQIQGDIVSTGRIAIGTTEEDPGYALTVKGKVHTQEVKVDLLGVLAPDYVFYEDYKLKTLEQVEDYIDQKGHLPNIPSASDMEEQGVNLKEMNMKLLEKVEELTLYTIAQEKAIKEQQEANDALEKRLQKLEDLLKQ